jgi:hypothetical protein
MAENPYAPPAKDDAPGAPPDEGGITFNDYDLERVSKATSWMRRVASIQFGMGVMIVVLAALIAALAGSHMAGPEMLIVLGIMGVYALILLLGGAWLKKSCVAFYDGIMQNAESGLALGFRKLRLYFILYGVFNLVGLAGTVLKLLGGAR